MVRVKICGITNAQDAHRAVAAGAWALGFIFHKKSPRYVSPSKVRPIIESLPPFVTPVGVFVNQSAMAVRDICRMARISTVQFHGEETPGYCKSFSHFKIIKAFKVGETFDFGQAAGYKVDAYLFDTFSEAAPGGTGKSFNWQLLAGQHFAKPVILSGGLNPENVAAAVEALRPYAVDVASGVEQSHGIKDPRRLKAFFKAL